MNHSKFEVVPFENRNGTSSWRVVGWLHGERVRKNFKTRAEAVAEKATLEVKAAQTEQGMRTVATTLTAEQVREAETVFHRLRDRPCPLSFYVDFALTNYKEPEQQKKLSDACADYIAARQREFDQGQLSKPQIRHIGWEMKRLTTHFPKVLVAEVMPSALTAYLEAPKRGMKHYNGRRGLLSTFFKFCFMRGWTAENPIPKVPHFRIRRKRGAATTLTAADAQKVMDFAEGYKEGALVPFFALCLFAGIRPGVPDGEISRLTPAMIDLEQGEISITAEVSKVAEPRVTIIQPNLAAWLRAYPLTGSAVTLGDFKKRRQAIWRKLGLTQDVMRHTFISMFVAKFRSIGEAAIQAGNSEAIIRRHYLNLKTREEADKFFAIVPRAKTATSSQPLVALPTPTGEAHAA